MLKPAVREDCVCFLHTQVLNSLSSQHKPLTRMNVYQYYFFTSYNDSPRKSVDKAPWRLIGYHSV